jgi:hypothetical protein
MSNFKKRGVDMQPFAFDLKFELWYLKCLHQKIELLTSTDPFPVSPLTTRKKHRLLLPFWVRMNPNSTFITAL